MSRGRIIPKQDLREAQAAADAQAADRRTGQIDRKADKARLQIQYTKPADAAAGTASTHPITTWRRRVRITWFGVGGGDVTAHATNYAAITLQTGDGKGGALQSILVRNTATLTNANGTGDWSSLRPTALGKPDRICEAGSLLFIDVAKAGTGVQLPIVVFVIEYEELD